MAVAILQARMSSSRLPGKVMKPILGAPMIARQLERLRRCETLDRLVVATSEEASDDALAEHLQSIGIDVFRGSLTDVLGRFVEAARHFDLNGQAVRLTADCPLADPSVIDEAVRMHADLGVDYLSNGRRRTYPRGLDVEVFDVESLRRAARETDDPYDREHVTPYLYRPDGAFTQGYLEQATDQSALRWTVDTSEDFAFVERVYGALYPANPAFASADILALPFAHYEEGPEPKT